VALNGRLLGTFLWLRWRTLAGGLTSRRRSGWRLVRAWVEVGGTLFLWLSTLGAALGLAVVALVAARALQDGGTGRQVVLVSARVLLGVVTAAFLVFPTMRGTRPDAGGRIRLQLLPIHRRTLFRLEIASLFADPWLILVVPAALVLGLALALGGAAGGWIVLVAAVGFVAALVALSAAASFGVELLFRSRRRAEVAAMILSVVLLAASLVPAVINQREGRKGHGRERGGTVETPTGPLAPSHPEPPGALAPERRPPPAVDRLPRPWSVALPSEAYTRALGTATDGRRVAAWGAVGALAIEAVLLFALASSFWRRLTSGAALSSGGGGSAAVAIPEFGAVTPRVTAVAWVTLRTALRTLPGRMALISPLLMGLVFVFLIGADWTVDLAGSTSGGLDLAGALLATGVCGLGVLSTQPLSANQLTADGTGLVLTFQAPLTGEELVRGKALGLGVVVLLTSVPGSLLVAVLRPGALPLWPAILLAAAAAACLIAPVFASLSAVFPKAVDLNRFGKQSQPHQLVGLLGPLTTACAYLPALALGAGVYLWSRSPLVVAAAEAGWLVVAFFVARFALRLVGRLVDARREDVYLALTAD